MNSNVNIIGNMRLSKASQPTGWKTLILKSTYVVNENIPSVGWRSNCHLHRVLIIDVPCSPNYWSGLSTIHTDVKLIGGVTVQWVHIYSLCITLTVLRA